MKPWSELAPNGTAAWCGDWRSRYHAMTYQEHQQAYDEILSAHPRQAGFDFEALELCILRFITTLRTPAHVLEFGGWRGGLAKEMLTDTHEDVIASWNNVEITPLAHEEVECDDPRYSVFVPDRFIWDLEMDFGANLFVSSHTIEHITSEHLQKLFKWLSPDIKWMFLQAPLPESCTDNKWEGYGGTHILEIGWLQVCNMLAELGWQEEWTGGIRDECMFFSRK